MALVTIDLATITIALFITCHAVANTITHVVTVTIAFFGV
jgi:hypothetical protein